MTNRSVIVLVDTPQHKRAIHEGQPPTTLAAYRVTVPDGQTVEDAMAEQLDTLLPLGSDVEIANEEVFEKFTVASTLRPVAAANEEAAPIGELMDQARDEAIAAEMEAPAP